MCPDRRQSERGVFRTDRICLGVVLVNVVFLLCYQQLFNSVATRTDNAKCPPFAISQLDGAGRSPRGIQDEAKRLILAWDEMKASGLFKGWDGGDVLLGAMRAEDGPSNGSRLRREDSNERRLVFEGVRNVEVVEDNTFCPEVPVGLEGNMTCDCDPVSKEVLQKMFPEMKEGRVMPIECKAKERVAIIVAYRDRYTHLHILIKILVPLLRKQNVDATFFVIEQDEQAPFNRALLQNVGFLESKRFGSFGCYIFHDADLVPMNEQIMYKCAANPRHLPVAIKKYGKRSARVMYRGYFGGVVALTRDQFLDVNGNSNLYFGWGGEDDDLLMRCQNKAYSVEKGKPSVYHYNMLIHERNDRKRGNVDRNLLLSTADDRQDMEGLSTTKYTVKHVHTEQLYIWISVAVNMTEVFQTAPDFTLAVLKPRSLN
ncbi:Beta-1,4-galactosyltransferase 4 [Bulinus truncatus]|nr:Beta-1,4-galactosyltransferase 4 [Bulinus truncatus]